MQSIQKMKLETKILIFFLILNFHSFLGLAQEIEIKTPTIEFDFSTIEKFRKTKLNNQIINDYDSVFSSTEVKELSDILYKYHIKTTRQIVVVTIDNIKPYSDIQKMATDLGKYWSVGSADKNNGLIILLCKPERKIGIATGSGTELVLTNKICKNIIENVMIPYFKKGDYYNGIKNGTIELINKWE